MTADAINMRNLSLYPELASIQKQEKDIPIISKFSGEKSVRKGLSSELDPTGNPASPEEVKKQHQQDVSETKKDIEKVLQHSNHKQGNEGYSSSGEGDPEVPRVDTLNAALERYAILLPKLGGTRGRCIDPDVASRKAAGQLDWLLYELGPNLAVLFLDLWKQRTGDSGSANKRIQESDRPSLARLEDKKAAFALEYEVVQKWKNRLLETKTWKAGEPADAYAGTLYNERKDLLDLYIQERAIAIRKHHQEAEDYHARHPQESFDPYIDKRPLKGVKKAEIYREEGGALERNLKIEKMQDWTEVSRPGCDASPVRVSHKTILEFLICPEDNVQRLVPVLGMKLRTGPNEWEKKGNEWWHKVLALKCHSLNYWEWDDTAISFGEDDEEGWCEV
jgi:hypothetical protein